MKVTGVGTTVGPGQTRKTGKVDKPESGSFAQHLADEATEAVEVHGLEGAPAVAGIDALLVAQAVGDAMEREERRRLLRHGEDILDKLEELRHGLLAGSIPKDKLISLAQLVRARREQSPDPRLAAILDEIELRAEVELAKLARREA